MRFETHFRSVGTAVFVFVFVSVGITVVSAQSVPKKKKTTPRTASVLPTPVPTSEPIIISRAEDYPLDDTVISPAISDAVRKADEAEGLSATKTITELSERIKALENDKKVDYDQKQKRLALNLDILTKAEQRAESLRKQSFELLERESSIKSKLNQIESDLRPESIDRSVAFVGGLRPEEIKAARKRSLETDRANLQAMLSEIQRTKTNVDLNVQRADQMVERLRSKLEAEIDAAIEDNPTKP